MTPPLSPQARAHFAEKGYVALPGFYDPAADIAPIQEGIRRIVATVCQKYGVDAPCSTATEAMTLAYPALIARDRSWGGEVYDAVKQIPAFMRLVAKRANDDLFRALRPGSDPGIAAGGYGIRIDNPGEERFRAHWHQEFPSQLRSSDGIVFWTPAAARVGGTGPGPDCGRIARRRGRSRSYRDGKGGGGDRRLCPASGSRRRTYCPLPQGGPAVPTGRSDTDGFHDLASIRRKHRGLSALEHPVPPVQFRRSTRDPHRLRGSFAAGLDFAAILPELAVGSPS